MVSDFKRAWYGVFVMLLQNKRQILRKPPFLSVLITSTVLFLYLIGVDASPYLRGPAPFPPEWRWEHSFSAPSPLWIFPALVGCLILCLFVQIERMNLLQIRKKVIAVLSVLLFLLILFQITILAASRGGLRVLFFKIAHPGFNGYFTASLMDKSVADFLRNYEREVVFLPMHAKGHPPGVPLLMRAVNEGMKNLSFLKTISDSLRPNRDDMRKLWDDLRWYEQVGSLVNGFLFSILGMLAIFPIYLIGKELIDEKAGLRAAVWYGFVPSVTAFVPLPDAFFAFLGVFGMAFFIIGLKRNMERMFFWSGMIFSIGLFFSLSILPLIILCGLLGCWLLFKDRLTHPTRKASLFLIGVSLLPLLLFVFFQYNTVVVSHVIMSGLAVRSYWLWLLYNPYDFFFFAGVPLFLILCATIWKTRRDFSIKQNTLSFGFLWSFLLTMLILNLSGASRAEVGRIWLPFVPILALIGASYFSRVKSTFLQLIIVPVLLLLHIFVYHTWLVLIA